MRRNGHGELGYRQTGLHQQLIRWLSGDRCPFHMVRCSSVIKREGLQLVNALHRMVDPLS
jgi:hypothetical protein